MRRLANTMGDLIGLLVLGALIITLALTFGGLPREAKPASQAFQSPIQTPTQLPHPLPMRDSPLGPLCGLSIPSARMGYLLKGVICFQCGLPLHLRIAHYALHPIQEVYRAHVNI